MNLKPSFFDRRTNTQRINHDDFLAVESLAMELLKFLPRTQTRPIVFVCIGTDRSTGDSLGPLVGSFLEEKDISSFHVYGTLDEPIHAVNLNDRLREITIKHQDPYIIGIDACLGRMKNIGFIQVSGWAG